MRLYARWMITIAAVFSTLPAIAGGIGFLDAEKAIKTVKEGQKQYQALDAWATEKSDEVEAMRDRMTELAQQMETQRSVATEDALKRLEEDLLKAQRDFEDAARDLKYEFEAKQKEFLAQVATRVRIVAGDYAAANGFDAVFLLESQPMVYIADTIVITDPVIRAYDERYPID